MLTHTLGFPRIGQDRELKKALEAYWKNALSAEQLQQVGKDLRQRHWQWQKEQGIDLIPVGDFSFYDHVLDTSAMLGAVPPRFGFTGGQIDLQTYFRMARGQGQTPAMEMSKWFDTNYHYIVPEFHRGQTFSLSSTQLLDHVTEALHAGFNAKPVLVGPLTYLKIGKSAEEGFDRLDLLDAILPVYEQVIRRLAGQVEWIQIDEPALVLDLTEKEKRVFRLAWERLTQAAGSAKVILATYFDDLTDNLELACQPRAAAVHVDLVRASQQLPRMFKSLGQNQSLSLGVVDGRNIWRVDADAASKLVQQAVSVLGQDRVMIGSSCSLLHSPMDLSGEQSLDAEVKSWLSFARQKCGEIRLLADIAQGKADAASLQANRDAQQSRR